MLNTAEDVRRHIEHKARAHELKQEVAQRMLGALAAGAVPDYGQLLHEAIFRPPPPRVFHTAPRWARADRKSVV